MACFKTFVVLLVFYSTTILSNCHSIDDGIAEEMKEEIQNLSVKVEEKFRLLFNHEEMTALIVGGWDESGNNLKTEIIPQGRTCSNSVPSLPTGISWKPSLVQTSEEEILLCGGYGNSQKCLELKNNQWQDHSNLKNKRTRASAVSMLGGIFLFGGRRSRSSTTWEWLPSGTNQWQSGNISIPGNGFKNGCVVKINDIEILLIGGYKTYQRVLKFNTNTKEFTNLGDVLNQGRFGHACTLHEDQVIIAGGRDSSKSILSSTEIINLNDLTKAHTTAGNLVQARSAHGLVVVHVDNKPTVLAVGGGYIEGGWKELDSIEMWNPTTGTWKMTSMRLSEPKGGFGILSMPTRLLCP